MAKSNDGSTKEWKGGGGDIILKTLGDQAPKLVCLINDSVKKATDSLENLRKDITESAKHCSPTVSMRLVELRTFLEDVMRKCYSYCDACKDLGEYGSDGELIQAILEDLELGKFTELNDFLNEIKDHLYICETRFERHKVAGEIAKKEVKQAGEEFERKGDEAMGKEKYERMIVHGVGTVGAGLTAIGAFTTFFAPPAGIAIMIAGVATGGIVAGLTVEAGYTQAQIEIFSHACRSVINLGFNLAEAMRTAEDMREGIYRLKTAGTGIERLQSATYTKRLKVPLKGLGKKMGQLSKESSKLMEKLDRI